MATPLAEHAADILIVDDEPLMREALRRMLAPHAVVVARSVAEARLQLRTRRAWRAFFLDVGLPDGTGFDLLAEARRDFPRTPAMVLTGHPEIEHINAARELDAELAVKPVRLEWARRVLERQEGPRASAAPQAGDLSAQIERLRDLLRRPGEARRRHAIGSIVVELMSDPGRYGARAVGAAARELGQDDAKLYRFAAVARRWPTEEAQALLARRGRDGFTLSWSHLVALASIDSEATRTWWVARVLDEAWSVRRLAGALEDEGIVG